MEFLEQYKRNIYNGDCLEFMKQVQDGFFDLVLTDPPYGIGFTKNMHSRIKNKFNAKDWDNNIPPDEIFAEIFRISKNQIIWGGNYFDLPPTKGFIVWDKDQPLEFSLAMFEYAWTSFDKPAKGLKYPVRLIGGEKFHPTMKPLEVFKFCLDFAMVEKGWKIFDPFLGSGTTSIVCESLELDWWGCELESDYVKIAQQRLKAIQPDMFGI